MLGQSALIIGATGQTGRVLLEQLLASSQFLRVGEYGRRVTPTDKIASLGETAKAKLEQKAINFEKLEDEGLRDGKWDVVFITLGTTKANAGSAAAFEKIDRDYVIKAARAAKVRDSSHPQRLVYLSAAGANSSSFFLYNKSKGLTEEGLARLGYSDTIVFRPGLLKGAKREETRWGETLFGGLTSALSHFTSNAEIQIPTLARAMYIAGKIGSENLPACAQSSRVEKKGEWYTVVPNSGAIDLVKADSESSY